jgi:hypothetical protein
LSEEEIPFTELETTAPSYLTMTSPNEEDNVSTGSATSSHDTQDADPMAATDVVLKPDPVLSTPKKVKPELTEHGFRSSPRGVIELDQAGVEYSHERRSGMQERDLQHLHKVATSPLPVKFGAMGNSSFTEIYDLESRLLTFKKRLHCYRTLWMECF